jgi:hypothetical protein
MFVTLDQRLMPPEAFSGGVRPEGLVDAKIDHPEVPMGDGDATPNSVEHDTWSPILPAPHLCENRSNMQ